MWDGQLDGFGVINGEIEGFQYIVLKLQGIAHGSSQAGLVYPTGENKIAQIINGELVYTVSPPYRLGVAIKAYVESAGWSYALPSHHAPITISDVEFRLPDP